MLLVILTGCAGTTTQLDTDIHTGRQGIVVTIENTDILQNVIKGMTLPINVKLENKGAYDVEAAQIKLIYDDKLFEESDTLKYFDLEGKKQYNPEGYFDYFEYDLINKELPSENKNSYLLTHTCYKYKTYAKTNICFGNPSSPGCNYDNYKTISLTDGQGAPIGISRITENVVESKENFDVILDIYIENFGNGKTTKPTKYTAFCETQEEIGQNDLNFIALNSFLLSDDDVVNTLGFKCQNIEDDNTFDLTKRHIVCTKRFAKQDYPSSFVTILEIELEYGYVQTTSNRIVFQNLEKELWS